MIEGSDVATSNHPDQNDESTPLLPVLVHVPMLPNTPPISTRVEFANLLLLPTSALTMPLISSPSASVAFAAPPPPPMSLAHSDVPPLPTLQHQSEAVVVLQARIETCHELIAAATAASSSSSGLHHPHQQHLLPPSAGVDSSNITNHQTLPDQPPQSQILSPITQIQGVVDLDALSAIAGVSRSELQTVVDSESAPDVAAAPPPPLDEYHGDENDIMEIHQNEDTPLLQPSPALSSNAYHTEILPYTLSPVFNHHHHNHLSDNLVLDTVLLKADAFVETLTDVLDGPHHDYDGDNVDDDDIESMTQDDFDGITSNYDDASGVTPGGAFFVPRPENLGANLRSNRQHAFLLEIPHTLPPQYPNNNNNGHHSNSYMTTTTSDVPSHFILAIPKQDGTGLWQDDVSDASNENNDDNSFLLGLSHLPTDVCDVQIEAIQYNDTETIRLDVVVKRQVPHIGYVILIGGLLALSSVGTALNLQRNVSPIMKSFWRYTCTWIVLLPITIRSLQNSHHVSGVASLTSIQWICFIVCALCYAFMTSAFVSALEYTTLANAFVLSNLAPLFIIVGRTVMGYSVLYMEGIGAMIGFIGGTVCTFDMSPSVNGDGIVHDHPKAFFGDSLAVMASAAVAIYLLMAKKLRPHIELFLFTFMLMFTSSIFVLLYMILTKEPMSFSNQVDYGLWGWTNSQWNRLPLELYLAIVCNIMGTTGYIAVMKYFEPIVVSTVMLSEPVLGALMAALVGSDPLPGLQTWIGNIVVAVGIFLVVWSGARSTETIDATKALLQVNNSNNGENINGASHHSTTVTTANYGTPHHQSFHNTTGNGSKISAGVPLLKNHPVTTAMNSPHRLLPNIRTRSESMC